MALSAYAYGTVARVLAYTGHVIDNGNEEFSISSTPTLAQVETFLEQRSALLNGCLANVGYLTPVSVIAYPQAWEVLAYYAVMGAAGDVELTMRSAGYDAEDQNKRENKFLKEFDKACAYIASGAFAALGAPTGSASPAITGLYVGGRTSTGQRLRPIFGRTTLGNNPTAESGPREPGWVDE
jgi:hypothetical protein